MKKLGFGLMRLPQTDMDDPSAVDMEKAKELVDRFIENGFSYFDSAYVYHGGMSENIFGELVASRYPREVYKIATKMPVFLIKEEDEFEKIFEEQLGRCRVDYFDYYFLHSLDEEVYDTELCKKSFDFIKKKHTEGKIKHLCFSFHDNAQVLDRILSEHEEIEMVLLQINYLDWEDENVQSKLCYDVCRRYGKKIAVMEPLKGGALANIPKEAKKIFEEKDAGRSCASWGIRFAESLEGVEVVLSGMGSMEQLEENMRITDNVQLFDENDKAAVKKAADIIRASIAVPCTSCRYCADGCPAGINIPEYFSVYNKQSQFGLMSSYREKFKSISEKGGKLSDCIACGQCEAHCPQHLDIIKELKKVESIFNK